MFLEDLICDVKILTVQNLKWSNTDADVSPRNFSALSLRMKGNATLCASKEKVCPQTGDILFVPENLGYYVKSDAEEIYVIHFKSNSEFAKKIELFSNTDFSKTSRLFSLCYEIWNKKECFCRHGGYPPTWKLLIPIKVFLPKLRAWPFPNILTERKT